MASSVTFKGSGGRDPMTMLLALGKAAKPDRVDGLFAVERQRTRILDRTVRGLDVDGAPFAPYSEKRPYYWYPGKNTKRPKAAAGRAVKKIAGAGVTAITGKGGVRFASYGAFKRAIGRSSAVDLRGPRAPHMLQAMLTVFKGDAAAGVDVALGVYGDEAKRASGHHYGIPGRLPRRRFLGANHQDQNAMAQDVISSVAGRIWKS